jgi:hypothetical protein
MSVGEPEAEAVLEKAAGHGAPAVRAAPRLLFPERNSAKFSVIRCVSVASGENAISGFSGFQVQKPQQFAWFLARIPLFLNAFGYKFIHNFTPNIAATLPFQGCPEAPESADYFRPGSTWRPKWRTQKCNIMFMKDLQH